MPSVSASTRPDGGASEHKKRPDQMIRAFCFLQSRLGLVAGDEAQAFQFEDHLMCAVVDVVTDSFDAQFR